MAHECINGDHGINETFQFASSSAHESSCSTSFGAIEGIQGNAEGSCTITISHSENIAPTSALAAARLTALACQAVNVRPGRLPSDAVGRMKSDFLLFETGLQYYAEGTLDNIKLSTVIKAFKKKVAPEQIPASLKNGITDAGTNSSIAQK